MTRAKLALVPEAALRTGIWRVADDESVLQLLVDGAAVCEIAPWSDVKTGAFAWWWAVAGERSVGLGERLSEVCRLAALDAGVIAPVSSELLKSLGETVLDAVPAPVRGLDAEPSAEAPLADRIATLLARILDEPLTTLAGAGPDGGRDPLQLRLSHYRPDLAERAAELLEEAGR